MLWCPGAAMAVMAGAVLPAAEVQELVYTTPPANNGAGPLWCYGSTCLVRRGDEVYIAGLQTVPERKPLNNVRWVLYHRTPGGWRAVQADPVGLQREPCPLVVAQDGRLFLSTNPTIAPLDAYNGPAAPDVLQFDLADPSRPPVSLAPRFSEPAPFGEHSYRGFAGDGQSGEIVLFNILGYDRYYWSFRDRQGAWHAGRLDFPIGTDYEQPVPIRSCYPEIVVKGRAVYLLAISDIIEPVKAWREYKQEITGQKWDYDFRRMFYTWTPDITSQPFRPWLEVASREQTAGHITNLDLLVDEQGNAHALWREQSVWNTKLRDKFFPDLKQTQGLYYGIIRDGKLAVKTLLLEGGEGLVGETPSYGRLHLTPDNRLFAFYWCSGTAADGRTVNENRLVELLPDGSAGQTVRVPFEQPFTTFMTATPRGGSALSHLLDLYGTIAGADGLWYGRVDLGCRLAVDFSAALERTSRGARLLLDGSRSQSLDGAIASWRWEVAGQTASGER
ncbi:MAG: hypothetical protein HUU35_20180, partial [Armatimonadetes bacterium]|nr:hypothetical protein [Armatimonadota bacterium]